MFTVLLALIVAGFGLSIYLILLLFLNPKKYEISYKDSTVVIVKIVELHRENLPLNSAHGWNLTPLNCNLRCWQKDLPFGSSGDYVSVYACSKEIQCAAVILLNVIADVSTWSEWDVHIQDQIVHLELPDSPSLYGDRYMQCDQVLTSSKLHVKPEIEMFRFGNLESNGTGWILLWSAKKLDWTLYIAQPIDIENSDDCDEIPEKCLLTAMWGCKVPPTSQHNMPVELCRKVLNLSEAISLSQLKIRPFQSLLHSSSTSNPHFPTIHSALEDLPKKPCVLLEHDKDKCLPLQNGALAVVPLSNQKPLYLKNITGFTLVLSQMKKISNSGNISADGNEDKRRSRRRHKLRSDSMSCGFPKMKLLDIENKRSSSLTTPARKKAPELTITQADDDSSQPPQRAASHSFLHNFFQRRWSHNDISDRSRSPSPSKKHFFNFQKTSSLSSQEDVSSRSSFQDLDISENEAATEFLSTLQGENTDFKSLGEYSISAVLQENLKAAMVNVNVSEDEQKKQSGGWVFKDVNKNIAVFKKTTHLDACLFISYLSKGIIPTPLPTVWKTLCNPQTRFMYDDTVKKISILHEHSSGQKLIHMYNESVTLLHKEVQDFCILQTEKVEGTKFILGLHSVKVPNCPPLKNVTRGTVVASGWVVEPVSESDDMCQVSYLIQMIVNSSEVSTIEEISSLQSQCIHNLSLYLTSKPPSFLAIHP